MKRFLIIVIITVGVYGAATVYDVELSYTDNFLAQYAIQTFLATADSISEVAFFCGRKINLGHYICQVRDSAGIAILGQASSDSAGLYDYELVSATFNPRVPVRKGFKYRVHIKHNQDSLVNFYYNRSNPYPDGKLIGHPGCDLAARIYGVNNFPKGLFGMNSGLTITPNQQPRTFWNKHLWKPGIDSMKAMGVSWDRNGFCAWQHFQFDADDIDSFHYGWCDSMLHWYARDSINVLWVFTQSTRWSSCCDSIDTLIHGRGEWYKGFPKNLFEPVLLANGQINPQNYFAQYVYKFVKRYGPGGDFWDTVNIALRRPIRFYEIWNEPEWLLGKLDNNNQVNHRWCNDSVFDPYYDSLIAVDNSPYKKNSLMKVYARMCFVADSAIRKAVADNNIPRDSVFTIFYIPHYGTIPLINTTEWLNGLREYGVRSACDGASIHSYATPYSIPYFHRRQKQTLDSVWYYMKTFGFGDKFLWCTEYSTGCYPANADSNLIGFPVQANEQLATITTFYANDYPKGPVDRLFHWAFSTAWVPDVHWENILYSLTRDNLSKRPPGWGFQQLTRLFKDYRLNQSLTKGTMYDTLRLYEFENEQTKKKMYVGWKEWNIGAGARNFKLPMRTNAAKVDSVAHTSNPGGELKVADIRGWVNVTLDTAPLFIYEPSESAFRRPDLVIDSIWINPVYPAVGDSVTFYALIRNIDTLQATIDTIFVHFYRNDTLFTKIELKYKINPKESIIIKPDKKFLAKQGQYLLKVNLDSKFIEQNYLNNTRYLLLSISR